MAKLLYLEDSYQREFSARIVSVEESTKIILDQTGFYPSSGGQPNDTGILTVGGEDYNVTSVSKDKATGKIIHVVNKHGLKINEEVIGVIDWDRRYKLMRMHTAAHLLSALFHKEGALITGNQLDIDKSRIDFSLEEFDQEKIKSLVNKANELIQTDAEIKISSLPREEALKLPGMIKLAGALPPEIAVLRIVKIEGIDQQADGGTHVHCLREIGTIVFLSAENKGKDNRRIYFAVE